MNDFTNGTAAYHIYWKVWHARKDERHLGNYNKQSANSSLTNII